MSAEYAVFTQTEHKNRLARARDMLAACGFEVCVSVAPETHYYLAGYDAWVGVNSPQALVFSISEETEPTLIVRNVDTRLATETTWLSDIRKYQLFADDFSKLVAGIVREKGWTGGRIAMELQSYALNAALYSELASALKPAEIFDATRLLGDLRIIKSETEMRYVREAAGYANLGLDAAREALQAGVTEIEVAAAVEGTMRAAGSDYWAIPTEISSGTRTPGGHATPRERVIELGDIVHFEFAGVSCRYHATAVHTMACGAPNSRAAELYEIARASLAAGVSQCHAGAWVADIEEASLEPIRAAGLEAYANMRFGYGIGLAYPPVWLETLQISRGFEDRLAPGMVFVLHAYLQLDHENIGIIQGGTWALTTDGLEQLVGGGDLPLEIV
ncbi:peptidase M24 [hydrothermal vent metagenome]|uniref:Peptidase M24 n=1 Tax=hydrothermal vent metagenome TaxID=652676 RepID=A0A170PQK9_9ZZZZ